MPVLSVVCWHWSIWWATTGDLWTFRPLPRRFASWTFRPWTICPLANSLLGRFAPYKWAVRPINFWSRKFCHLGVDVQPVQMDVLPHLRMFLCTCGICSRIYCTYHKQHKIIIMCWGFLVDWFDIVLNHWYWFVLYCRTHQFKRRKPGRLQRSLLVSTITDLTSKDMLDPLAAMFIQLWCSVVCPSVCLSIHMSVCPSVCLSGTGMHCDHTVHFSADFSL